MSTSTNFSARPASGGAIPPRLGTGRRSALRVVGLIALLGVAMGACALIYFFDPAQNAFYPGCTFHRLTGLNCPGCGATRASYALLHGHWLRAFQDNALFVVALAAALGRGSWYAWRYWQGRPVAEVFPVRFIIPFVIAAIVFGILRNLPGFGFLSP